MTLRMRYPPFGPNEGKMRWLMKNVTYTQSGAIYFVGYLLVFIALLVYRNCVMDFGMNIYRSVHANLMN